ncbi:pheromone autoinducer 2 transporter [Peptococcaceae bacterium CEB3]|nr:pheromone autoinducer 2 transporter [Peptococcaceae bacterium CEB3]
MLVLRREQGRWVFLTGIILGGAALLISVRAVIGPFLLGFALAYLLNPLVEGLERKGVGRYWAIAVVFVTIIGGLILAVVLSLPVLYTELAKIAAVLPRTMQSIDTYILNLRGNLRTSGLPERIALTVDEHLAQGEGFLLGKLSWTLGALPDIVASLSLYILAPILAIYFLADWHRLRDGFAWVVPQRRRAEWLRLWRDINHVIRRFIRGNLVVAAIVGVLIGLGSKVVGMDYALLIGLISGISDLIPYFGPFIGAVPVLLLALTKSPLMAGKVALVIIVVQQLEGNFISPKLMGDSVRLHPIWIVFVLLAGGELAGFWGLLLAVPLAAVLKVVLRYVYLRLVSPII